MKYMERHGSGLRKIVSETEKLPGYIAAYNPEISSTATDFRVILKNVNYQLSQKNLVSDQVSEQDKSPDIPSSTAWSHILRCCNFINCHVQIENSFFSLPKLSSSNSLSKLLFTVFHALGQMERADSHKTSPGTQQFFSLWVPEPVAEALCQNVPCRIRKMRYFHSKLLPVG